MNATEEENITQRLCMMFDDTLDRPTEISDSKLWFSLEHPKVLNMEISSIMHMFIGIWVFNNCLLFFSFARFFNYFKFEIDLVSSFNYLSQMATGLSISKYNLNCHFIWCAFFRLWFVRLLWQI